MELNVDTRRNHLNPIYELIFPYKERVIEILKVDCNENRYDKFNKVFIQTHKRKKIKDQFLNNNA